MQKPSHDNVLMPKLRAAVSVAPETLDADARTVEVRFYSGAAVQRYPLFDEPYELAFSLDPGAVRLERFNAGAPVVDNHRDDGSVSSVVLGVVERAWLEADGGHARIRFSARDAVAPILQDVRDGILRNFSMGAVVHRLEERTEKDDPQRRFVAVDWEPHELSVVPVPADWSAQALATAERFTCQLSMKGARAPQEGQVMDSTIKVRLLATGEVIEIDEQSFDEKLHSRELAAPAPTDLATARRLVDEAIARKRALEAETERVGREYDMSEAWITHHKKQGTPTEQVIKLASEHRAAQSPYGPSGIGFGEDRDSVEWRKDRLAEALAARAQGVAPPDPARQYARFSFSEACLELLKATNRAEANRLHARHDALRVFELGLHTTSDFPLLLGNVLNKVLLPAYESAMPTYRQIAQQRTFNDFRVHRFLRPGDFPVPVQVGEGGEYTYGTASENEEQITMLKYGRILGLSMEMLVNDDMGAFAQTARDAAVRTADFENATFYQICITAGSGLGPAMSDAVAVYNLAAHGNVTGAGVLSITLLDEARELMANQQSLDGIRLNVAPSILLVSPEFAGTAERLVAPQSLLLPTATMSDNNNWAGRLRPLYDANLTGARFYVLADPATRPQYIYGGLAGQTGPRTEVRNGFNIDGVEFKLSVFFGCGPIEHRYGVTGQGS